MKRIVLTTCFICCLSVANSQVGQYLCDYYVYYCNNKGSEFTPENPQETFHQYLIDVNIDQTFNKGAVNINDMTDQITFSYDINGKLNTYSDENGNGILYAAILNAYGFTQQSTVLLIFNSDYTMIESIVVTSIEFNSKGHFIDLVPVEKLLDSYGSGFIISSDGYILTNYHVVEGAKEIIVKGINGDNLKDNIGKLVVFDEYNDLALLKINPGNYNINFNLLSSLSEVGDDVFVLGYPLITAMGSEIKLTNGIISAQSGFKGDKRFYQVTAPVQPGNSGCPMFDYDGNIIGMISAGLSSGDNVGYALKSSIIISFLNSNDVILPIGNSNNITSFSAKVKVLKNNIVYIKAVRK